MINLKVQGSYIIACRTWRTLSRKQFFYNYTKPLQKLWFLNKGLLVYTVSYNTWLAHAGLDERTQDVYSTHVKTHKLLQVCKQVVTNLFTSCQQVVFALLVPSCCNKLDGIIRRVTRLFYSENFYVCTRILQHVTCTCWPWWKKSRRVFVYLNGAPCDANFVIIMEHTYLAYNLYPYSQTKKRNKNNI
jgi:hypothetical protein